MAVVPSHISQVCLWTEAPNTPPRCVGGSQPWRTWAQTISIASCPISNLENSANMNSIRQAKVWPYPWNKQTCYVLHFGIRITSYLEWSFDDFRNIQFKLALIYIPSLVIIAIMLKSKVRNGNWEGKYETRLKWSNHMTHWNGEVRKSKDEYSTKSIIKAHR